jgi:uncharacterized protein
VAVGLAPPPIHLSGERMSDQNAQEPTMEEILASIRRIISEDDAPAEAPPAAEAAPEPAAAPVEPEPAPYVAAAPEPEPVEEDDVLDLTDPMPPPAMETHGDLDIYTPEPVAAAPEPPPPAYTPPPEPAPVYAAPPKAESALISDRAASASASAFSSLAAAIAMPSSGRTLEDVTRELLKPLLSAWLEENLPRIVEAKVAEEVERIARGR